MLRARRKPTETPTHAGMGGALIEGIARLVLPPIIRTIGGALIGVAISGSRHVTIVVK